MNGARKWQMIATAGLVLAAAWTGPACGDFYCSPRVKVPGTNFGATPMGGTISPDGLNIGCGADRAPGSFWSGLIDDVRIYNRVVKP